MTENNLWPPEPIRSDFKLNLTSLHLPEICVVHSVHISRRISKPIPYQNKNIYEVNNEHVLEIFFNLLALV